MDSQTYLMGAVVLLASGFVIAQSGETLGDYFDRKALKLKEVLNQLEAGLKDRKLEEFRDKPELAHGKQVFLQAKEDWIGRDVRQGEIARKTGLLVGAVVGVCGVIAGCWGVGELPYVKRQLSRISSNEVLVEGAAKIAPSIKLPPPVFTVSVAPVVPVPQNTVSPASLSVKQSDGQQR